MLTTKIKISTHPHHNGRGLATMKLLEIILLQDQNFQIFPFLGHDIIVCSISLKC